MKYIPENIWSTLGILAGFVILSSWQESVLNLLSGLQIIFGCAAYKIAKQRAVLQEKNYILQTFEFIFGLVFVLITGFVLLYTKEWYYRPVSFMFIPLAIAIAIAFIKTKKRK